jgi:hypothetical protein
VLSAQRAAWHVACGVRSAPSSSSERLGSS